MAGPLAQVDTQIAGPLLDVDRLLAWGPNMVLELYVPDQTAGPSGMRLVRRYERAFNRVTDEEGPVGNSGETRVFHLADSGFPVGQVPADVGRKELHVRWILDGSPSEYCKVNNVDAPSEDKGQTYVITAHTRTFKQTYFGR